MWMYAAFSQLLIFRYEVSLEIRRCLEKVFAQKFAVFFLFGQCFLHIQELTQLKKKKSLSVGILIIFQPLRGYMALCI